MIEIRRKENCCGCQACSQSCPVQAIRMSADAEGFWYPQINKITCIACGLCEQVCPQTKPYDLMEAVEIWGCYRRDLAKRMRSASGGIFAVLAEAVLRQNGVVFGAAFNDKWELQHCFIETVDDLDLLLGSKYVQSNIGNAYVQAKEFLLDGRTVLFGGTPCQVQGLKKYLGREYDHLLTVDLICHGVPSPGVWSDYLSEIEKGRKLIAFTQRDKSQGMQRAPLVFRFNDGRQIRESYDRNVYMRGFDQNLYLRPSCYACKFKGVKRCSDLTIGDFWGFNSYFSDFGDHYGVSVVLVHSEEGKKWFESIEEYMEVTVAKIEQILPQNPCLVKAVPKPETRDMFFGRWRQQGVSRTVKQILRPTLKQRFNMILKPIKYYIWLAKKKLNGQKD